MQDRQFHYFIVITIIVPLEHDSIIVGGDGPSAGSRNSTIPQLAGRPERHASSPKSLSKVRSTLTGVLQTCSNVVVRDAGVVPQNVCFRPALPQQAHYEIHRQPAAPDNRLSSQHRRIKGYAVSPVHV